MKKVFEEWWEEHIKDPDCPLKRTAWSYTDVGIIKDSMKMAYNHTRPTRPNETATGGNLRQDHST